MSLLVVGSSIYSLKYPGICLCRSRRRCTLLMTKSLYAINFKEWLRRNRLVEALLIFALVFSASYVVLERIEVKIDNVGLTLINHWCSLRDVSEDCYSLFNSKWSRVEQALSLSLFITAIALTAISMHLRYFAAVFSSTTSISRCRSTSRADYGSRMEAYTFPHR